MSKHDLEIKCLYFVHFKINTETKMVLIEAVKRGRMVLKVEPPLLIYKENRIYSEEMEKIYKTL